jgi:hypothetical protein
MRARWHTFTPWQLTEMPLSRNVQTNELADTIRMIFFVYGLVKESISSELVTQNMDHPSL